MNAPEPAGEVDATTTLELSANLAAVTASSWSFPVATDSAASFASVTALLATVVANDPVPEPVTSPVRVMVWSPVLVPELVPL